MPDNSSGSRRPVDYQFNAKSRDAKRWAKRYAGKRITNLNKETKLAVRKVVTDSIRDGVPPRDAAKQIREMVGLNRPQGLALRRYVDGLSPTLTTAAKAKAGIKLKNKMIRRRAITIARTEVIDSLSAGVEKAWQQAQGTGLLGKNAQKQWVTTPVGACVICRVLNGQTVPIGKFFKSSLGGLAGPTAHPNCRCGIAPVPDKPVALEKVTIEEDAAPVTRVGITSFRTSAGDGGDFTNRQVYRRMGEFKERLEKIKGVTDTEVRPAVGAWMDDVTGDLGSEPSWAVSYSGNGEARRLAAEFGSEKYGYNQDAVLMIYESDQEESNGVSVVLEFEGAVSSNQRDLISNLAGESGMGGWTWSKQDAKTQLTMTSVDSWGTKVNAHLAMVDKIVQGIKESAEILLESNTTYVRTEVLDESNYESIVEEK